MPEGASTTPKSKSGQLADLLRTRIMAGEWMSSLPSERQLAAEYFVSRTAVREAFRALAEDGLVEAARSTRRGRTVRAGSVEPRTVPRAGQVMLVTPSLRESPLMLEHLAVLREWFGQHGTQVHVREAVRLTEESEPERSLRRWSLASPDTVWVLHKMPAQVQRAAQDIGLKAIVFGSVWPGVTLPSIDVDFRAVVRHAAGRCLARGHRRLAVIVHRTVLAGDAAIVEALGAEMARHEVPPPMVLKHDFNRARLIDALDHRIIPPATRPEALLVVNQHHLLTVLPHLLHRGLRIPHDLSLVYLSNDPTVERLSPLPDRYDLGDRLLRRLALAAQARLAGERPGSVALLPRFLKGETLG